MDPLQVAGLIFLIIAILHLVRLVLKVKVVIGPKEIPLWISAGGFIVCALLSWWMLAS
jgi:hypothetical protein